jgi:hypothetical protein
MTSDELKILRALTEACDLLLKQHAWQTMAAKMYLARIDQVETFLFAAIQLLDAPDCPESRELSDQLRASTAEYQEQRLGVGLADRLAQVESDHEKIELMIAQVRDAITEMDGNL